MKPQIPPMDALELFQAHFDRLLNAELPLVKLANQIDGERFDQRYGERCCEDNGAPAKPTRLMVGLNCLKHAYNESVGVVRRRVPESGGGSGGQANIGSCSPTTGGAGASTRSHGVGACCRVRQRRAARAGSCL